METSVQKIDSAVQHAMDATNLGYPKAGFAHMINKGDDIYFGGLNGSSDMCGVVLTVDHSPNGEFPITRFVLQFPGQQLQVSFCRSSNFPVYFKPSVFDSTE